MGQKDIAEKTLESYNDVFADIVNVLLFNGEEVIKEQELEDTTPRSAYKADGKYHEIERDVAKQWKKSDIRLACLGVENQTYPDKDMPLRVLAYDGAEYRSQLNQNIQATRYPVVTLVLYFNHKKQWDKPLSLIECLNIPDKFRPFVNDYRVNFFDIAFLSDEQVKLFKSDFKFVADYFVQMRTSGTYIGSSEKIKHVQETLSLLSVMTQDSRFDETLNTAYDTGKEIKTMSEFLDTLVKRGEQQGEEKGAMMKATETALSMIADGVLTVEQIAKYSTLPIEKVLELKNGKTA